MEKQNVPELFGSMVFDDRVMRARLSSDVYESLRKTIDENEKLDEEVARLHLEKIGVHLTKLTQKQADYIGVPVEGPYKSEHYKY